MSDAFDGVFGQPRVRDYLRTVVSRGMVGQAYLFTGPAGSNKTQAAYALAQAIICKDEACGECEPCRRVMRRKHPDVRYYSPEGAAGYLVSQIREITTDVSLAPIQADCKVYILDRVDLLGTQAANAFLKTLEEPPDDVTIIMLGRTVESVLPTIVSRCQVVPFRMIPASEAAGIICANTAASETHARMALEACDGSITRAVEFLRSNERMEFRSHVFDVLSRVEKADDWDLLRYASDLVVMSKAPLDAVRAEQEEELAATAEFLARSAIKQIELRNKRALSARGLQSLRQLIALVRSWLRDVMMVCAGTPELVINEDVRSSLVEAARLTDEARLVCALRAVKRCEEAISYNVSPETCIDAMLFEVKGALYGKSSRAVDVRHR